MFRELVKITRKICFIGENSTVDTWVSLVDCVTKHWYSFIYDCEIS